MAGKTAKTDLLFYFVLTVMEVTKNADCYRKISETAMFQECKKLPATYHENNKAWMTTDIFSSFLRSLDASMGAQNRNILLFVDNCAAHPKDTSFLRNVKVIRYLANCTSVLQPLDLGVIKCYKQLYRKRLVQTAVCLMDAGKEDKRVGSFALHCGSLARSNPADNQKLFSEMWLRAGTIFRR
jgi:hypothetical protein